MISNRSGYTPENISSKRNSPNNRENQNFQFLENTELGKELEDQIDKEEETSSRKQHLILKNKSNRSSQFLDGSEEYLTERR